MIPHFSEFMMSRRGPCQTKGCRNQRESATVSYCSQCQLIRTQHRASHLMEGHYQFIPQCPTCERGPQTPKRDEQCPARGPALSHTQDLRVYPDGRCVHCRAQVVP